MKNSFQNSPPTSPARENPDLSEKELTIQNTQLNAGRRRSSSAGTRPGGSRKASSRTPSISGAIEDENQARLKWDEANIYLTEQERTSTMKIDEPKTPYAKHYDPSEDPSDDEDGTGEPTDRARSPDDIPGLSLGEPEEPIPEPVLERPRGMKKRSVSKVHVDDTSSGHDDDEIANLSEEDKQKHRRFEEMRKKHYEMKDVAHLLGHPEMVPDVEDDDVPPLPPANGNAK